MANTKITSLTALTGANAATGDLIPVVDVSDATMAASGTNKKMTRAEMFSSTPVITTSDGTLVAPAIAPASAPTTGFYTAPGYGYIYTSAGAGRVGLSSAGAHLSSLAGINWKSTNDIYGASGDTFLTRYAAKQLMISGDGTGATTNAGWIAGYAGVSGYSGFWPSTVAPSISNYLLLSEGTNTFINSPGAGYTRLSAGNQARLDVFSTAGQGAAITAGTATTDVAALSVTRTNNNAAVTKGVEITYTDTTSAAGFLPFAVRGGAAGTTDLMTINKVGQAYFNGTISLNSANFATGSGGGIGFYNNSNSGVGFISGTSFDTNISRVSAGVYGVGTGAAGSTAGSLSLTNLTASSLITVGTGSGTSAGLIAGYMGISSYGALWSTGVTPSTSNYAFTANAASTFINAASVGGIAIGGGVVTSVDATGETVTGKVHATTTLSTGGYTVATLPAGTIGMRAYVTDATAPTYLGALTGGGAVVTPVFYNGSAWVSH